MRMNLWSTKTGLSLFAAVVLAVMLFEHVRGVEPDVLAERAVAADPDIIDGPMPAETERDDTLRESTERVAAAGKSAPNDSAEESIRKTADAFTAAFDRGDAAAIAALWTVDGEYIDGTGKRFAGRGAIERQYARFFAEHPAAKIEITIDAIRPISADAAIEDGHASLLPRVAGEPASSPYTVVHAKVDGRWLMASVREPQAVQSASDDPLSSLDWLVGSWRAEQNGLRMDVTFRWVANRSFLERSYSVEQGGRITASGVQLIGAETNGPDTNGRDTSGRDLRSWSFTSDAGYAVGTWIPQPDGWAIATRGKLPNGTTTGAVNYLTRLGDNTLAWQSRERKTGGVSLPDTAIVRLVRVARQ